MNPKQRQLKQQVQRLLKLANILEILHQKLNIGRENHSNIYLQVSTNDFTFLSIKVNIPVHTVIHLCILQYMY